MKDRRFFRKFRFLFLILNLLAAASFFPTPIFAQSSDIAALSKEIIEAKDQEQLLSSFEALKGIYFKDHEYTDFVGLLKSLSRKKKRLRPYAYYYTALSRFNQLRYLEQAQEWNEYFANKDIYQDELLKSIEGTLESAGTKDPLYIYARLLLCRYYRGLWEGDLTQNCLIELVDSAQDYAKSAKNLVPLKDMADQLMSDGNKSEAKILYGLFAQGLAKSGLDDAELKSMADQLFQQQQLSLAETVYELYLSRIRGSQGKPALINALREIAQKFAYRDLAESEPLYAENKFRELEEIGGKEVFSQELIYLRAFNLEKMHEYSPARMIYRDLVELYPGHKHADEATFKIGVIDTYLLENLEEGKKLFKQLAKDEEANPWAAASLYQLGLLAQWGDNTGEAKSYYDRVLESAKDDTLILAEQRLGELKENIPLEYNLKTFLDLSLKKDASEVTYPGSGRIDLRAFPPKKEIGGELGVDSEVAASESGCIPVELRYLWSGYLGEAKPSETEPSFFTEFKHRGSKVINLVVVTASGIVDYGIEIVDIY